MVLRDSLCSESFSDCSEVDGVSLEPNICGISIFNKSRECAVALVKYVPVCVRDTLFEKQYILHLGNS